MFEISYKAARVNAELRQADVAAALSVDRGTVIRWENGLSKVGKEKERRLRELYRLPDDVAFRSSKKQD